ncbi:hypothetical protein ABZ252_25880 [Streptomyces sp. NPDC006175]|uniref:hypothetical protein n=1 Tax=unclassified Streptomyces TaxID=2593676 RepID=UPI0033BCB3AB
MGTSESGTGRRGRADSGASEGVEAGQVAEDVRPLGVVGEMPLAAFVDVALAAILLLSVAARADGLGIRTAGAVGVERLAGAGVLVVCRAESVVGVVVGERGAEDMVGSS